MTVSLKDPAGKSAATHDKHLLVVLLQLFHQGDEVAVATYYDKGIDVVSCKRHLEGIQRQVDIRSILVAARSYVPLDHMDGMLPHGTAVVAGTLPVSIRNLGDNLTTFLDCLQD